MTYGARMKKKRDFETYDGEAPREERKKPKNGHNQDYNSPEALTSKQKTSRSSSQPHHSQKPLAQHSPTVPFKIDSTNGTARDSPSLPPIHDELTMKAVFTHQGVLGGKDNLDNNQSYERLEFLGDAYIEVIASRLLWDRFPTLSPGRLSALRELLVKNETLCEYALQYQFDRRVTLPTLVHEKGFTKIMGDVFEAYVAAVIVSNPKDGYAQAEAWLTQLWTPKLDKHKDTFKSDKLAKQELSKKLGGKGIQIQYVDDGPPEQLGDGLIKYYVSVYLTGWGWTNQRLGSGEGFNKIEAGNAAATWALTNTPLIDDIAIVKQAFDAKVRAQRESQCQSAE